MRLAKAEVLLEQHRARGDQLLIITSTNRFVTAPIAELLGVDALLATEPAMHDGRYTGEILFEPCYQAGKISHLERWLQQHGGDLADSYFYSDSINDRFLLERVRYPVAVDPDPVLRALAEEKQWQIISLRSAWKTMGMSQLGHSIR